MSAKTVYILGAGVMGTGITQVFAMKQYEVVLIDVKEETLEKVKPTIQQRLRYQSLVKSQIFDIEGILNKISLTTDLNAIQHADIVIENVTENWEIKKALYQQIDVLLPENALFCVNTSAVPITKLASILKNPERVVGAHFMNPVPLMPMVEVIKGQHTSLKTLQRIISILEDIEKKHVVVKDSPGFVTNRAMMIFVNEAIHMLQESVAEAEEIDTLFRQCFGHKMGPLQTADLIGLDTILYSLEVLHSEFNDQKYSPCWLLKKMVAAGFLGEKSGHGFYQYETIN